MTATARETTRIGLVTKASTTFNESYNLARQFKALDLISHGRTGWNGVTTSQPAAAANFGQAVPARAEKDARAHEVIQVVQTLWSTWGKDAWIRDVAGKRFADVAKIQPINRQGTYVASRGPLPISPSEQRQSVVFQAGRGRQGFELAGRYASGVYANPYTTADAQMQRQALRAAAQRAGRHPDEVKLFVSFMPTIASSRRAALDWRRAVDEPVDLSQRVGYLETMLGLPLSAAQLDEPLTPAPLAVARPSFQHPRSTRTLERARKG